MCARVWKKKKKSPSHTTKVLSGLCCNKYLTRILWNKLNMIKDAAFLPPDFIFSQVALDHISLLLCIICLKVTTSESFCWVYGTFAYSLPFGTFSWCFAWFCKYWLDCKHFVVSTFMLLKKVMFMQYWKLFLESRYCIIVFCVCFVISFRLFGS